MTSGFDPIISMVIELKNAAMAGRESYETSHSKYREAVASVLSPHKFFTFKVYKPEGQSIKKIRFDFDSRTLAQKMTSLRIYSRPGRRLYADSPKLKSLFMKGRRDLFLSTSRGVMSISEALKRGLGGQLLFEMSQ